MTIFGYLLKIRLKRRWLTCLAYFSIATSADIGFGQITNLAVTTVKISATNAVRTADIRWFGINSSVYCPDFNLQNSIPAITKAGWTTLRFPGGSIADNYHWAVKNSVNGNNTYANFAQVATNLNATVIITANYGSGTAAEAAAWVANANITNNYGFKYWEIGNEEYGTYETDNHANPHDPYTYATNFAIYFQQMKAVDPTIKIGVIVTAPSNPTASSNGYNSHPATNLITGQVYYGWTPVVMSTLRHLGVTPDFVVYHYYPQDYPYVGDSDQGLLTGTLSTGDGGSWANNAIGLRGLITDFFGPGGSNIELLVTENNSEEGTAGKQSVSLVNGLYYADSLGQLMKTEFNSLIWWDYTDAGPRSQGDLSTNLYGWRQYGDLGAMKPETAAPLVDRYPQYFAAELISHFIRAGDTVLNATSDNSMVSAYASVWTNGLMTLLAINKSPVTNYPVNIKLSNYDPRGMATLYCYGMPQDNAAEAGNNALCDVAQTTISDASTNFDYTLAPYSMTVFTFTPATAFLGLGNQTITYGAQSVTLTGTVSTNGIYPPDGTAVTVTINGNAQGTATYDSTGDFTINYNTIGLPASVTPYTIIYSSAANGGFPTGANATTTLTVNPLPVVLTGSRFFDGTTTVMAANLSVSNLISDDSLTLTGNIGLAGAAAGSEAITDFSGLILGGASAANYTLVEASGAVTIMNYPTPVFSNLTSPTITYGSSNVTLTGKVSANGSYPPTGTIISVTINFSSQTTSIYDGTGDFTINYNIAGLPAFPFTVTYSSAAGGGFSAATNTSTTLTINPLPIVLTGDRIYDGTTTAAGSILSLSNLVGNDNVTLAGSVGLASAAIGPEAITDFSGITLGGTAAWDYTLTGASGTVMITPGGVTLGDIRISGSSIIFSYSTISGQTYQLQYATNLISGTWLPQGDAVPGTGAPIWVTNDFGPSRQMFFRLSTIY